MTTTTQSLSDFLLAQIAADEEVARAATPGPWWYDPTKWNSISHEESVFTGERGLSATTVASTGPGDDAQSMADAAHIARHDPARVLAECAAKKAIVAEHPRCDIHDRPGSECDACQTCGDGSLWPCPTLRALALPYRDAPSFDDAWLTT
jgi:hypothetical protein